MEIQTIPRYPESNTQCSEIVLTVRIVYDKPFVAPGEWYHEDILKQLVNEYYNDFGPRNSNIQTWDINCTGHVLWVELKPIKYKISETEYATTQEQELLYRDRCRSCERAPSQAGFWRYVLKNAHGIQQLP